MISSTVVASSTFTTTRFRAGYDISGVDAFLAKVRDTLASYERRDGGSGVLSAVDVVNARFRPTQFRTGYDQDQVDALLDQVAETVREYEGRGKPTII